MVKENEPWSILRALRAAPPGSAGVIDARRVVFAAALEQAEQFLTAASAVGYATKPVQLFYALSQAGRAIAAARADEPWEIVGHGAKVKTSPGISGTSVRVDTSERGALGLVARATGSELWEGPVNLGSLWGSLPELPHDMSLIGSGHPPLEVGLDETYGLVPLHRPGLPPAPGRASAYTASPGLGQGRGPSFRVALRVRERPQDPEDERALVERVLAPYPKAVGWSIASGWTVNAMDPGPSPIFLEWSREDDGNRVLVAPQLLTEYYEGALYFRPGLGKNWAVPSPLVTWWGLLLALSQLARYEPVAWRQALDIDHSPIAWALERGLTIAERRIPELVLRAVS
jgi:hypothetical protein